jgi:hypothetical protein
MTRRWEGCRFLFFLLLVRGNDDGEIFFYVLFLVVFCSVWLLFGSVSFCFFFVRWSLLALFFFFCYTTSATTIAIVCALFVVPFFVVVRAVLNGRWENDGIGNTHFTLS